MYRELGSFERLLIVTLVVFASGVLFAPSAIAQSSAQAAKAKFANDYNAGKFKEVIADGDLLRKNNVLDAQSQLIIGQAYFKAGDFAGCVRYSKSLPQSDDAQGLQARCAYELKPLRLKTGNP